MSPLSLFFFFSPTFPSPLLLLFPSISVPQEQLHIELFDSVIENLGPSHLCALLLVFFILVYQGFNRQNG